MVQQFMNLRSSNSEVERSVNIASLFLSTIVFHSLLRFFNVYEGLSVLEGVVTGLFVGGNFVFAMVSVNLFFGQRYFQGWSARRANYFTVLTVVFALLGSIVFLAMDIFDPPSVPAIIMLCVTVIYPVSVNVFYAMRFVCKVSSKKQ